MRKLAIFVEGLTEQLFVERLINEIAGHHNVRIRIEVVKGKKEDRRIHLVTESPDTGQSCYILIRNCMGDHNVANDVRDQYNSLVASGYIGIIGIRDLYPRPLADLSVLLGLDRRSINFGLRTSPIKVQWIFALMETEAWFLAEHTHFHRLHPCISCEKIYLDLGFDPRVEDMELRAHPAFDLHSIYSLKGLSYQKTPEQIVRTINALDFAHIYVDMEHVKQLRLLTEAVEDFITASITL